MTLRCIDRAHRSLVALRLGVVVSVLSTGLGLAAGGADAADRPGEPWPSAVHARYRLSYMGLTVGHLDMTSATSAQQYTMSGSAKVSALFGAVKWSGNTTVSGAIETGAPRPAAYAHQLSNSKKSWATEMHYKDRNAPDVAITPPPGTPPADLVPLTPQSKVGALDPLSAVMMLTRADGRPPCARRLAIFDGKQRYDLVFSFKRMTRLPVRAGHDTSEVAVVCRVLYEPIAGHRANEDTKAYVAHRDTEVVLRRIPGTEMLIPYSITVPTTWGTGAMTMERIEVTTTAGAKVALME
jgi:hypothetical protein